MKARIYRAPDGVEYPMEEAKTPIAVTVYRSDRRKAKLGDPACCIIALGINRTPGVVAAFVGGGKDAYVIFEANGGTPATAFHYTVPAKAARVRDTFDQKGAPKTQIIWLQRPTPGRTHDHRAELNKRRREEIKAGAEVNKRGTIRQTRIMRLGVPNRPSARIVNKAVELAA